MAPSDEGAVANGDWGRENYLNALFSLPQSASLTAPSSEGALIGASDKQHDKLEFEVLFIIVAYITLSVITWFCDPPDALFGIAVPFGKLPYIGSVVFPHNHFLHLLRIH